MVATVMDDRIRGSLLGLAWGDAIGWPVEGWSEAEISAAYADYRTLPWQYSPAQVLASLSKVSPRRATRLTKRARPPGLHSDDTQQALALIAVCLSPGGWSVDGWARWLVAGMEGDAWRAYGRNFRASVLRLGEGERPERSGAQSAGMGAAMRITPLGALYYDDHASLVQVAMESSLVTHADLRAAVLAYAVAYTTAQLIAGREAGDIWKGLAQAVAEVECEWLAGHHEWPCYRPAGPVISDSIARLTADSPANLRELQTRLIDNARPYLESPRDRLHPNQGFALLGGLHALLVGLWPENDASGLLSGIIRLGGDADTVGAICGGILGARFGDRWIPTEHLYDRDRLLAYAQAIVSRDAAPEDMATFISRERELTEERTAFRQAMREAALPKALPLYLQAEHAASASEGIVQHGEIAYLEVDGALTALSPQFWARAWLDWQLDALLPRLGEPWRAQAERIGQELENLTEGLREEVETRYKQSPTQSNTAQGRGEFGRWVNGNVRRPLRPALFERRQLDEVQTANILSSQVLARLWRAGRLDAMLQFTPGYEELAQSVRDLERQLANYLWDNTREQAKRRAARTWVEGLPGELRGTAAAVLDELVAENALAQAQALARREEVRRELGEIDLDGVFAGLPSAAGPIEQHARYVQTQPPLLRSFLDKRRRAGRFETALAGARRILALGFTLPDLSQALALWPVAAVATGLQALGGQLADLWRSAPAGGGNRAENEEWVNGAGALATWARELRRSTLPTCRKLAMESFTPKQFRKG